MLLGYAAIVSDVGVVDAMRQVRIGGVSASMYFLAVDRLIPNSRAIPRMDIPLRFAFCIALHRAFSSNVGFRGGMTATLPAAVIWSATDSCINPKLRNASTHPVSAAAAQRDNAASNSA